MRGEYSTGVKMSDFTSHWTNIHQDKDKDVSWWQENLWLDFLNFVSPAGAAIDVGSGQSPIAIELVKAGFSPVYINDIAVNALEKLVSQAHQFGIELVPVPGSVLNLQLPEKVNLWHDRAVFHFLGDIDVSKYKQIVIENTAPNAFLVIATFSENGPDQCSNLTVSKYSPKDLVQSFSPEFKEIYSDKRIHTTPWSSTQEFSFVILQKLN
jgi:hypothetical protein